MKCMCSRRPQGKYQQLNEGHERHGLHSTWKNCGLRQEVDAMVVMTVDKLEKTVPHIAIIMVRRRDDDDDNERRRMVCWVDGWEWYYFWRESKFHRL